MLSVGFCKLFHHEDYCRGSRYICLAVVLMSMYVVLLIHYRWLVAAVPLWPVTALQSRRDVM